MGGLLLLYGLRLPSLMLLAWCLLGHNVKLLLVPCAAGTAAGVGERSDICCLFAAHRSLCCCWVTCAKHVCTFMGLHSLDPGCSSNCALRFTHAAVQTSSPLLWRA